MRKYTNSFFLSLVGIVFSFILIFSETRIVNAVDLTDIEFVEKPIDYNEDSSKTYSPNETVNFKYNLINEETSNLSLYLDVNRNEIFAPDELVYEFPIYTGNNSFSFQMPNVFSGLLSYKIVIENDEVLTHIGTLRVKSTIKPEIKVLNIVSRMVDNRNGLFNEELLNEYFKNNDDYTITVNRCNIKDFSKNNSECSHRIVMDIYDVIILGPDIFDKNPSEKVLRSIKDQLELGKPFIFTSSITKGHKKWVEFFANDLSLSDNKNESEYKSNNINRLQIVNESNYVLYPHNMFDEELTIPVGLNYAFAEDYQMDLTNPNLVSLMNMYNTNNPDSGLDSENTYYYTKNENVVYLNVGGNIFKQYKDIEHKLFVDSIVNLYIQNKAKDTKISEFLMVTPTFEEYIFLPYGNVINDLSTKFIISKGANINSIEFTEAGDKLSIVENNGIYKLVSESIGEQNVNIVVEDIHGNIFTDTFLVKTYDPIQSINLENLEVFEGQVKPLPLTTYPVGIDSNNLFYEISSLGEIVEITRDGQNIMIEGINAGIMTIKVYGYDLFGNKIYSQEATIKVKQVVPYYFENDNLQLLVGDTYIVDELRNNLIINYDLTDITFDDITFESTNNEIVSIDGGNNLTAIGSGTVIINATTEGFTAKMTIEVFDSLSTGFNDELIERLKFYPTNIIPLEDLISLNSEGLDNVEMNFNIVDPITHENVENELAELDNIENTLTVAQDVSGDITLKVTITYTNSLGDVTTIEDYCTITISTIDENLSENLH